MTETITQPPITATCQCGNPTPLITTGQILTWLDTLKWDTPAYLIARAVSEALVTNITPSNVEGVNK